MDSRKVLKIERTDGFCLDDEIRMWRNIHTRLLKSKTWSTGTASVWVDYIYRPGCPLETYLSLPESLQGQLPALWKKGRRGRYRELHAVPVSLSNLNISHELSVCELRLQHNHLFALSESSLGGMPETIELKDTEMVRISFCLTPVNRSGWTMAKSRIVQQKVSNGSVEKQNKSSHGRFYEALSRITEILFAVLMKQSERPGFANPWLSKDTLRKLNDLCFKVNIRIAAPQRLLPKLSRLYQQHRGDNYLTIHFLPRREQLSVLRKINHHQRPGMFGRPVHSATILGSREIVMVLPVLSERIEKKQLIQLSR